jgi:hypothetical protein
MAIPEELQLGGMTPEKVFEVLQTSGVRPSDAGVLVSSWIFDNFGFAQRTFGYAEPLTATEPDCVSTFERTFLHADWTDGQSTVQAGQTAGEAGFNERFHRIEADLDALGANVALVFACVAELRQSLHDRLEEIRAELNRINADVNRLDTRGRGVIVDPVHGGSSGGFGGLVNSGNFLGATTFGGNPVTAWSTSQGVVLLPAINTQPVDPSNNTRVQSVVELAQYLTGNPLVQSAFSQPLSKEQIVARFGNDLSPGGTTVASLLDIVPAGTTFRNPTELLNAATSHQAAALRTTGGLAPFFASALGVEPDATLGTASVERLNVIPPAMRRALIANGVDTIGELSDVGPERVVSMAASGGVAGVTSALAAGWIAAARTLQNVSPLRT